MRKVVIFAFVTSVFLMVSCTDNDTNSVVELTASEQNDLLVLREEEKLARDVYLYSFDKYGTTIFNNIASSEQNHMNKVLSLINLYQLQDPVLPNRGEFNNQELQTLYNDLTAQASISLTEALKAGATIEDLDIKDIAEFENRTNNSTILNVYAKLKCGSRNHMRGFYGELVNNGVTYTAQFITALELESIITSSNEQCGRQ